MVVEWLPMVFSAGWASGINAYAVVLIMGLLGRFAHVGAVPELLTRPSVLIAAAVLFAIEVVTDKVPYLDSVWDSVHTVVRPVIGGALGALLAGDADTWQQAAGAATGSGVALASHFVKASLRLAVNTSPEPASNVAVSTAEDATVAGVVSLAMLAPWVAAGIAAVLLVAGLIVAFLAWRSVRRGLARWRARKAARLTQRQAGATAVPPGGLDPEEHPKDLP